MGKFNTAKPEIRATEFLELSTCPWCSTRDPLLVRRAEAIEATYGSGARFWSAYTCRTCGGMVTAAHASGNARVVMEVYPEPKTVPAELPPRAREFLEQAIAAKRQPAAAVVVAASSVDEMLRAVGFAEGTLNASIRKAAESHRLTPEMVAWAHHIRIEANGQRHPKPDEPMPTADDAEQVIEFALALGEYLFVLPSRVTKGLAAKSPANP